MNRQSLAQMWGDANFALGKHKDEKCPRTHHRHNRSLTYWFTRFKVGRFAGNAYLCGQDLKIRHKKTGFITCICYQGEELPGLHRKGTKNMDYNKQYFER